MASKLSFAFGGDTGINSPEELARQRALVEQLMGTSPMPHSLGQGLSALGEALGYRMQKSSLAKNEASAAKSGQDLWGSTFGGTGQIAPTPSQDGTITQGPVVGGDTFAKIIQAESAGNPNAVSPKGAMGLAQIMPATARDPGYNVPNIFDTAKNMGVPVADNSDATLKGLLLNPQVNATFGRAYFDAMKKLQGGNEQLAAASYNAGPGAVAQAGGVPNIPETQAYVQKLGLGGQQAAAPQQAAPQGQQGPSMDQLLGAINNPAFRNLPPVQQKVITDLYQSQVEKQQQANDPAYQLKMKTDQLQYDQMAHPDQVPLNALQQQQLKTGQLSYDQALHPDQKTWEDPNAGDLYAYDPKNITGGMKLVQKAGKKPVAVDKPPAAVNINMGGGTDKQIFDVMTESTKSAQAAVTGLNAIREARKALPNAITGAGADQRLGLQKIGALLGVVSPDSIVDTETFRAAIAPQVAAMLKSTVGTTNISNTDREFAEKAVGGNISLDSGSISKLLGIMEAAGTTILSAHQKRLDSVYPNTPEFARERALFGTDNIVQMPTASTGSSVLKYDAQGNRLP